MANLTVGPTIDLTGFGWLLVILVFTALNWSISFLYFVFYLFILGNVTISWIDWIFLCVTRYCFAFIRLSSACLFFGLYVWFLQLFPLFSKYLYFLEQNATLIFSFTQMFQNFVVFFFHFFMFFQLFCHFLCFFFHLLYWLIHLTIQLTWHYLR